jgi:UDP-glucuronate decarboxylase
MIYGKKYALVAGGAGFIGSHLVDSLIEDDWVVDVLDNFVTGDIENLRYAMSIAAEIPDRTLALRIMSSDIVRISTDPVRQSELVPLSSNGLVAKTSNFYDVVYNLACPASPKAYQANPIDTVLTSVVGTANLLALAESHQAVFVQASTSEIYGNPLEHPQKESYLGNVNSYGPRACYDESKRTGETLCYEFRKRGVDVRVARIFNTYGPRMSPNDGRVVSTFVKQAIVGDPITVFGDGNQTRSFCYVTDLVKGLRMLAEANSWTNGPVNIGNDSEFRVIELVEMLSEWFPRILAIHEPLPKDDPVLRKPDLSLAKNLLNYQHTVSLRDGLELTIEWMKSKL